jgi:sphinganine C4-monooxygenase
VLDSLGAALAHSMALMTVRQAIVLFAFSTLKTVDDHGGYAFPWWLDPLHLVFPNTAEYHDVHHQMQGLRYNYSQPFFIHFDILFGTRMSVEKFRKMKEAKASKSQQAMKENGHAVTQSDEKSTTTALQNGSAAPHAELRKRDAAPKDIVSNSTDPFVTTDTADYEQKAGVATS